ncbi:hypothetical protein O181_119745 [Austropuccinia psidii MF-1]|uniref:Uncharacterized protein n=1 Tax=Austropuccinia psidii MF-1 TaxID=1389203 RepID=A0A9Q3KIV6_9BASI|nr:hypothetical protein [Austropuccinia psidii MF-1]
MLHTQILMLVQVPTMLKSPYAYVGCQRFTRQSLCLCRFPTTYMPILSLCKLPTIHTPILTLVKVPKNSKNPLCLYRLPTIHTPILTLVKGPHNAKHSLRLFGLPTLHTPILTPLQGPNNSHTNPYACAGSRQFTHQSLRL